MVILGSFIPRNYFTFYWNNIVFGIKLQLRSWSIKRYYSFRPIASYRDARGEDTNAHTHAHLFLLKWSVTLSEIACRLPGFQRDKDRIRIIGKSIGVSSPGNIYVHDWMFKLGKILTKYNYGSKIYPENQVILDCLMPSASVKVTLWYGSLILISCSGLKLGKIDMQLGKKVAILNWEWGRNSAPQVWQIKPC